MFCLDNYRRSAKSLRNQSNEVYNRNYIPNKAIEKLEDAC